MRWPNPAFRISHYENNLQIAREIGLLTCHYFGIISLLSPSTLFGSGAGFKSSASTIFGRITIDKPLKSRLHRMSRYLILGRNSRVSARQKSGLQSPRFRLYCICNHIFFQISRTERRALGFCAISTSVQIAQTRSISMF
jgi:hypothetical protein